MAIFHQLTSDIIRGTFTCAMATAAYRSGSLLKLKTIDYELGKQVEHSFDFSSKSGVVFSTIFAPAYAPKWVLDRQMLWQSIEDADSRYDAHLAREYVIALPEELTEKQNIELIRDFVTNSFVGRGIVADVNFHNDHSNNPHLHIMFPTRMLSGLSNMDQEFVEENEGWKSNDLINALKKEQAHVINKYLTKYGHNTRVTDIPQTKVDYQSIRPWL